MSEEIAEFALRFVCKDGPKQPVEVAKIIEEVRNIIHKHRVEIRQSGTWDNFMKSAHDEYVFIESHIKKGGA